MGCQHVNKDIKNKMGFLGIKIHTSQFPQQMVIYNSLNYLCLMMVYSRNVNEGTRAKGRQKWTDLHMVMHDMIRHTLRYSSAHPKESGLGKRGERSQKRTRSPISAVSSNLKSRRSQDAALQSWESSSD